MNNAIDSIDASILAALPCKVHCPSENAPYAMDIELVWPYHIFNAAFGAAAQSNKLIKTVFSNMNWVLLDMKFEVNHFGNENNELVTMHIACCTSYDEIASIARENGSFKCVMDKIFNNLYSEICKARIENDLCV